METAIAILISAGGIWAGIAMMAWFNWQRGRAEKSRAEADQRRAEAEENRHKEATQEARDRHMEAMQEARNHHAEAMKALDTVTKALSVLIERTAPRPDPAP